MNALDRIDYEIVRLLRNNARLSNKELAEQVRKAKVEVRACENEAGCPFADLRKLLKKMRKSEDEARKVAAELAGLPVELLVNPDHLVAIHQEFELATAGKPYVCPIPADVMPPQYGPDGDTSE